MQTAATVDGESYATIRAIDRAIDVLQAFTHEKPTLTLGEVAERANLSKPTAFRVLASLRQRGFIEQQGDRSDYSLGFEIITLAAIRKHQTKVWEIALPYMRRIRDAVNETVFLCMRVGDERYIVDQVESTQPIRRVAKIGERVPLYAGASSRVLLAACSDAEIEAYLDRTELVPLGPSTLVDRDALLRSLRSIRELGYAFGHGERAYGGSGLAVGIRDYTGETVAALQVTLPGERWSKAVRSKSLDVLMPICEELSTALGHRTPPSQEATLRLTHT